LNIKPVMGVIPNNKDSELLAYPKNENFWKVVNNWQTKGWEISMHGYSHIYDQETNNKDYFKYGGKSEFFGHSLENQSLKIKKGLEIFRNKNIKIRSFFSPNHTYDINTFEALKLSGINEIIDGYGLKPYLENNIKFIPQLFYKPFFLPFGLQTTQIHLNYWSEKDFISFAKLIKKNAQKIISYDEAVGLISNKFTDKIFNSLIKKILIFKRAII
ncbi:DUF2334 domain-containing protein, partial [Pelagibacteraceae bacterium]|nr:DUF2334 domain-containing protein [Pelagibacteraceae bacterium]